MTLRFLLILGLGWSSFAHGAVQIQINSVQAEKPGPALSWPARFDWKWYALQPDVPVVYSGITLTLPVGFQVSGVNGKFTRWVRPQPGDPRAVSELQLILSSLRDRVTIERTGAPSSVIDIQLTFSTPEISNQGCDPFSLQLVPDPAAPQKTARYFPLGISCVRKKDDLRVTVTAPEDVEWTDATVFEVLGKGERWKQYSIAPGLLATGGVVGRLTFTYQGSPYPYLLQIRQKSLRDADPNKAKATSPTPPDNSFVHFRLGVGGMDLSVSTPFTQGSVIQPGIYLEARTRRFLKFLDLGARVKLGVPLAFTGMPTPFYEMQFYLGFNWDLGSLLTLSPRVGFLSMGGFYNLGQVSFQVNQLSWGLDAKLKLSGRYALLAGVLSAGVFPSSSSTGLVPEVGFEFPFLSSKSAVVLGYQLYQLGDVNNPGNSATFNQILGNWIYQF